MHTKKPPSLTERRIYLLTGDSQTDSHNLQRSYDSIESVLV